MPCSSLFAHLCLCPGSQAPNSTCTPASTILPKTVLPQTRTWQALGRGGFGSVFRVATEHLRGLWHPVIALKAAALTSQEATLAVYNELAMLAQCNGHHSIPTVRRALRPLSLQNARSARNPV